jgi:DDE superfamily endonuclease
LIERAYTEGEALGVAVGCQDEAGPFQTLPYPGTSWQPEGHPARRPHEYVRQGTAKVLTLFHPASGRVQVKGVTTTTNAVLHAWVKEAVTALLAELPPPLPVTDPVATRACWTRWQEGLSRKITLPAELPALRLLLIWDHLTGHRTPELVLWLFAHGVMVLFTPLSGSWLNMAESIQRILKRRALEGQHPQTPQELIEWLEATARAWNAAPTPFVWGGKRAARRQRARERRHALGGSGACTRRPLRRRRRPAA